MRIMQDYHKAPSIENMAPTAVPWRMYFIFGIAGIFITSIVGYGFYAGSRINATDVPLVEAAMTVKLEAAVANLLLEELIAEGMALNFDAVWENLDRAMASFQEALAQSRPGFLIFGSNRRPVIQREFYDMTQKLAVLKKSAQQRLAEGTKPFLSTDTEKRYRKNYDAFLGTVNGLEHNLRLDLTRNLKRLHRTQAALLVTCFLLSLFVCIAFMRFERRKARGYATLYRAKERMAREIDNRLRAETALAERTLSLERSNKELEQFAYAASHDLQEPLRMVVSYLQLLERRYKGKLDSNADDFIQFAVDGANRMREMIKALLSYSRVDSRGKPFAPVSMEKILTEVLDNLNVAVSESGAAVTHGPLPDVLADAGQMTLLFQNLIANAIKFRRDGPPRINISAVQDADSWTFAVRDNGIGIEPEYMERIFDVFQRLNSPAKYAGTGIGLAICKRIVERHRGRLWVESEPGAGSTFFISLPMEVTQAKWPDAKTQE